MATTTTKKRAPNAQAVKEIRQGETTVNVANAAKTDETVTVLFRSRQSLKFRLGGNRSLEIAGNAVYLANAQGGALPVGGYGVTVVDKSTWDEAMRLYGKAFAPWFRSGRLKVEQSENAGVATAFERAEEKTGDDPIAAKE